MPRIQLTPREAELIQAFRQERAIYNHAITDAVQALQERIGDSHDFLVKAVLALRKED